MALMENPPDHDPAKLPEGIAPLGAPEIVPYPNAGRRFSARRPWSNGEIVAWVVIVAAVLCVAVGNGLAKESGGASAGGSEMLPLCRYIVGLNHVIKMLESSGGGGRGGGTILGGKELEQLTAQVDKAAKTPPDRLRAAIVHGEIEGRDAALIRVDSLGEVYPSLTMDAQMARQIYEEGGVPRGRVGEDFAQRYGWFAHLAASAGKADSDPERAGVIHAALGTMAAMAAAAVMALAGGGVGLVLLIIAIVFLMTGRIKPLFAAEGVGEGARLPADRRTYGEAFALFIGLFAAFSVFGLVLNMMAFRLPLAVRVAALPVAFGAGALWPVLRGQSWKQWRAVVGLHAGRGIVREILAGLLGYLAGFPIFLAGVIVTVILVSVSGANPTHPINDELGGGPWVLLEVFVLASLWAPVTEELMFRGTLFGHLRERFGWWISAPVVALIFAAIHPQGWAAIPALASLALVLAGIREWRGSIIGCMAAHALHNTMTLVVVYFMLS